jgi:hypothetical protein
MKYDCNETSCSSDNQKLFEDNFNFLPEILYNGIEKTVERLMDSENLSAITDPMRLTSLILSNVTSISQMKGSLMADFFKYQYHKDFFTNNIPTSFKSFLNFKVFYFIFYFPVFLYAKYFSLCFSMILMHLILLFRLVLKMLTASKSTMHPISLCS